MDHQELGRVTTQASQQAPVQVAVAPTQVKQKKGVPMLFAIAMLLIGLAIGGIIGVIVERQVFDAPTLTDRYFEASLRSLYGDDYEQELENQINELEDSPPLEDRAEDTERKTDLNVIHTQLEVFYNDNGFYPNDSVFQSTSVAIESLPGLTSDALEDPNGLFINTEGADYQFEANDCDDGRCNSYTLYAELTTEDVPYLKSSLNQ